MILFELQCERGDRFEAWFRSNGDYDAQAGAGHIECPLCGSAKVAKALMMPAVPSQTRNAAVPTRGDAAPAAPRAAESASQPVAAGAADVGKAMELMQRIVREVRAKSDYVGPRFAEEARKIHYEEVPPRSIYGEASPSEMKDLAEEGVGFHPLPALPEDRN